MLTAKKELKIGRPRLEIADDRVHRATLGYVGWRGHAQFELDGRLVEITPNLRGSRWTATENGRTVAEVEHPARKHWTVSYDGGTVTATRTSLWRGEYDLRADGRSIGTVRRLSRRKPNACLVLSEPSALPDLVATAVLSVRVLVAQRKAQANAAASAAASGG